MHTLKPGLYLGIDGGGTKTEAIIANENGFIVGRGLGGGANPHNVSLPEVHAQIAKAVNEAIEDAGKQHPGIKADQLESGCLGLAGIDTKADRSRVIEYLTHATQNNEVLLPKKFVLVNDGLIGLKAGTDREWGVCLLASTGCNVYGVNRQGKETTAGNWGYLLGDQASGFAIGQKIIRQVIKESDGRLSLSPLTDAVLTFYHMRSVEELIPWAYGAKVPVREIASLAQLISNPSLNANPHLIKMVNHAALELLSAYSAVVRRLHLAEEVELPVVLLGGLFNHKETFTAQVEYGIKSLTPQSKIVVPKVSAVEGALKIAHLAANSQLLPDSAAVFMSPTH